MNFSKQKQSKWVSGKLCQTAIFLALSGCLGKDYHTHTAVFENGSVERTITTQDGDSSVITRNLFGISAEKGWVVEWKDQPDSLSRKRATIRYTRKFQSVEEANEAMFTNPDALFKIKSELHSSSTWFYSYLDYSDTYQATIKFRHVNPDDFFTVEDYAFINERRKSGIRTSTDSSRQKALDQKFEAYIAKGFFEDVFEITHEILGRLPQGIRWTDSARRHKERIYRFIRTRDFDADYLEMFLTDTLKLPVHFSQEDHARYELLDQHFISIFDAFDHSIEMPYDIVDSNADSVRGKYAFWKPQGNIVKDFTMQTKSRRANTWAMLVTGIVTLTLIFFARKLIRPTPKS